MKLFHPRTEDWCYTLTSTYGGGLVSGDNLRLEVTCHRGSKLILGASGYTQVFKGRSSQHNRFRLEGDSFAVQFGQPVVPHADSSFAQKSQWLLDGESSMISFDWLMSGRVARGERFCFEELSSELEIRREEKLLLRDQFQLRPERQAHASQSVFGKYDVLLTITMLGPRIEELAKNLRLFWNTDIGPQRALSVPSRVTSFSALPKGGYQLRAAAHERIELQEVQRSVLEGMKAGGLLDFTP